MFFRSKGLKVITRVQKPPNNFNYEFFSVKNIKIANFISRGEVVYKNALFITFHSIFKSLTFQVSSKAFQNILMKLLFSTTSLQLHMFMNLNYVQYSQAYLQLLARPTRIRTSYLHVLHVYVHLIMHVISTLYYPQARSINSLPLSWKQNLPAHSIIMHVLGWCYRGEHINCFIPVKQPLSK